MKRTVAALMTATLLAWLVARSLFVCAETEEVLVTQFGRVVRSVGSAAGQAGLKFKAPWQDLVRIDLRSQVATSAPTEVLTLDKKTLEVGLSVIWRVKESRKFLESLNSSTLAEERLAERATAQAAQVIARHELADLVSTASQRPGPDALGREIATALDKSSQTSFGIEVTTVLIRRIAYPTEIRPAIFDQIRAERAQVASRIRAEAKAKADNILAQARRDREATLARARSDAEAKIAAAEAEALGTLNEAHSQDPKLYELVRMLETYKTLADQKTTVIISSGSPLWKLLWQGPTIDFAGDSPPVPGVGPAPEPIGASPLAPKAKPEALVNPK